jgi:hypothetical protein
MRVKIFSVTILIEVEQPQIQLFELEERVMNLQ